jgi:hypothetical protein
MDMEGEDGAVWTMLSTDHVAKGNPDCDGAEMGIVKGDGNKGIVRNFTFTLPKTILKVKGRFRPRFTGGKDDE